MEEAKSLQKKDGCVSAAIPNMVSGADFHYYCPKWQLRTDGGGIFFQSHTHWGGRGGEAFSSA